MWKHRTWHRFRSRQDCRALLADPRFSAASLEGRGRLHAGRQPLLQFCRMRLRPMSNITVSTASEKGAAPIVSDVLGNILVVTLNRLPANAIDAETSRELGRLFSSFRDDPGLRV